MEEKCTNTNIFGREGKTKEVYDVLGVKIKSDTGGVEETCREHRNSFKRSLQFTRRKGPNIARKNKMN